MSVVIRPRRRPVNNCVIGGILHRARQQTQAQPRLPANDRQQKSTLKRGSP